MPPQTSQSSNIPPPPPGYTLDSGASVPPPPPGYQLDSSPQATFTHDAADRLAAKSGKPGDTGVGASLKRTGSGLLHLPGTVLDAFTKPPQDVNEQITAALPIQGLGQLPPSVTLGIHRLFVAPLVAEQQKADALRQQAYLQKSAGPNEAAAATNAYSGTEHMANMHDIASKVPVLGPMSADIVDRYLHGDKSGAATDLGTAVAGPKVAEGVLGGAAKVGTKIINKVAPDVAERLYQSALKPSTTIPIAKRADIVRTGLDSGIPISQAGAEKISGLISDLNDAVSGKIKAGAQAGQTVDPSAVAARLDNLKTRFANQVNPESDLAAIEASKQEFLGNNPDPISASDAQAMKQGTYQQLKSRAYGEEKSATTEAQKALARGLKEELENQFPEIKGLNAQESKLYNLNGVLEKAINRIGNHQLIGIGTPIATTAAASVGGAFMGHTPEAAALGLGVGVMKAVLDDPMVKSRLAIAISKAGRGQIPSFLANARVNQFANALAQSQATAPARQFLNMIQGGAATSANDTQK